MVHFRFFDRIIIRGHITRFFTSNGMGSYASQCGVKLKDFSKYAESVTNELKASVKAYAEKQGRPLSLEDDHNQKVHHMA